MKYKFKLPIGDWSDDGHGKCDYYTIESNINPEDLVEIVHNLDLKHKFSKICSEYEEYEVTDEQIEYLKSIGLNMNNYFINEEKYLSTDKFAQLFLDIIMLENPNIKLNIINDNIIEFNNWFGQGVVKKKGLNINTRSVINSLGYGLFI
jgi:hypothetical protein